MSALCQKRKSPDSFDHLVGAREQCWWDFQTKVFGCLQVDHKLEFGRLHHRQVAGFCALEDASNVGSHLAPCIAITCSVTHQSTGVGKFAPVIDRRNSMARRKSHDLIDMGAKVRIGANEYCAN